MTTYSLPYGRAFVPVNIPDGISVDVILPPEVEPSADGETLINQALDHPVDGLTLDSFRGAKSAAIAINDKTRPVKHEIILPPLLKRLELIGIPKEKIQLMIATGTHTPMPAEEFSKILPADILARYPVYSHNCDDTQQLVDRGMTPSGTPVFVNKRYFEADLKIVVGNIEPHHFMGFSGGNKSASIGVTGRNTINRNHSMLVNPACHLGAYETNPMRMDVEEIGDKIGVQFALNVIPNREKRIIYAFSGNPREVMKTGIRFSREVCQVPIRQTYDVVIASGGGYPKDINLYQSQKAITHSSLITRDGGSVILAAECIEGSGSAGFERFMNGITSYQQVFEKFSQLGFEIGPHKAFQLARDAARIGIYLVSTMPDEKTRWFMMTPAKSPDEALQNVLREHPEIRTIAILPRATNTIPVVQPGPAAQLG
jgi:nickel-dependent lactate racemase